MMLVQIDLRAPMQFYLDTMIGLSPPEPGHVEYSADELGHDLVTTFKARPIGTQTDHEHFEICFKDMASHVTRRYSTQESKSIIEALYPLCRSVYQQLQSLVNETLDAHFHSWAAGLLRLILLPRSQLPPPQGF